MVNSTLLKFTILLVALLVLGISQSFADEATSDKTSEEYQEKDKAQSGHNCGRHAA